MFSDTSSWALPQLNNYISVAIMTAVGYDYVLTLPNEIEYVWVGKLCLSQLPPLILPKKRPWSWVSMLFIVVRYVGCSNAMVGAIFSSTFVPWSVMTCVSIPWLNDVKSLTLIEKVVMEWMFPVFLGAADLLMILRIFAIYNRSRRILAILLAIYIPQIVLLVVATVIYTAPSYLSVSATELTAVKACVEAYSTPYLFQTLFVPYVLVPRLILGALLLIFATTQFVKQSINTYNAIKRWRSNRYMTLFLQEGVLYFIVYLLYNVASLMCNYGGGYIVVSAASGIFPYILVPRFVISVRELRSSCIGEHVDTGFGVASQNTCRNENV
ncbi:hypothetical protein PAXINDRAFT_18243 [Paxillus involutus ATCC 200175]|uniref:DUF6533 domain-containing protein n=1 Tax=Paxillus involutus ATCC 200175 TaxID=664439 RepID=A0A0C9TLL7_PAXIN|nr:hypothetical protein PAXINDRAFT_18243 [Paxillus involutus ATCC 200175]